MVPQKFCTRITNLFGIAHPIVCGGMMWLADAEYVSAVARSGGIGFLTPRSFPTPEDFREQIRKSHDQSDGKPFGVNLYVSAQPESNQLLQTFLDISIDEGVKFVETAGFSPKEFMPKIKDAGITVMHKCTTVRHALSAQKAGVDAIAILGAEAGGHPGVDMVGTMVQGAIVPRELDVPVVLAGGMGTGRQLLACLSLGAEGMLVATRMVVAEEIWAHENYKKRLAELGPDDTRVIMSIFGDNSRVIDNASADAVLALEAKGNNDYEAYRPHVKGTLQRKAYENGDWTTGTMSIGQSVAFAGDIEPVEAIIDGIMEEATSVLNYLNTL
ncbi:MAG: Nitronate monooxygenase [Alphaproteobacteria bacterium MarineAlpha11_Bin1]|nr:MAG: Nitronate monooxygenase [Alphaproteobacteria bacterium MarineAlpha11_Bin1]|tara:strand:- start:2468 stop:3451 length:984 start_codon:yes stop_codon:yes gene_type:complete